MYKYNEGDLLSQIQRYIDQTYEEHYSGGKDGIQTTEFIIDNGDGIGFTRGNVVKYAQRYGKKGGYNRKDILKMIHYGIIMLYVHDRDHGEQQHQESFEFDARTISEEVIGNMTNTILSLNPNQYYPDNLARPAVE